MLTDDDRATILAAIDTIAHHAPHEEDGALVVKLRAIATRPSTGTVGELLATAPLGSTVEWFHAGWCQAQLHARGLRFRWLSDHGWNAWVVGVIGSASFRLPARLVPADQADADPESRGPL